MNFYLPTIAALKLAGSLGAAQQEFSWSGAVDARSIEGGVQAHTVNGSIRSEFPVQVSGKLSHRHRDAKLGNGGRELKLSTVNGSIQLRRNS